VKVDPSDGRCRTCGGELEITETDDATMSVECTKCGDEYQVEPDAFGDGAQDYYVEANCREFNEPDPEPPTLRDYLVQLKVGCPVLDAPWEDSDELYTRVVTAEPGTILLIDEETYFYFLELLPPRFQMNGQFFFGEGTGTFIFLWRASTGKYYARPLSDEETDEFCRLARVSRVL
jgi:hypothetical protein